MFSDKRNLRLFSKRLLRSLKHPTSITKPPRLALESYLRKTLATPVSYRPDEAAKRRKQNEINGMHFPCCSKATPTSF
ncbi:MAG: hypothetical protein N3B10_06460 [Armatimonadetes bacterium]|nr:hypothetical protein [Armatimonadota bacterium]